MFAAIVCPNCGRNRIIDLASSSTRCPYCSVRTETKRVRVLYKAETARDVKCVLDANTTPREAPRERKDRDPMSTLEYNYGKAKGIEKLEVLSRGLTEIKGTFTVDDVEAFEPGKGERTIGIMLDSLMIIEERPGRYRAC